MNTICQAPVTLERQADWLVATRPWGGPAEAAAEELLRQGSLLLGNARLVRGGEGVTVIADVPIGDAEDDALRAEERLLRWLDGAAAEDRADVRLLESLLAERGLKFEKPAEAWIVSGEQVAAVTIRPAQGGFRVERLLLELEAVAEGTQRLALAEFLCRAHERLRFARCELSNSEVLVVSWCEASTLSVDITHALESVRWVGRQLIGQVKGFAHAALAECYLDFVVGRTAAADGGGSVSRR